MNRLDELLKLVATARVDARGNFKYLRGYFIWQETQKLKQEVTQGIARKQGENHGQ